MEDFSVDQQNNLKNWAAIRDETLIAISQLKTEKESLLKMNTALSNSNTEIQNKIVKSEGRLEELEKKEKSRIEVISKEIIPLEKSKSELETAITGVKKEFEYLQNQKIQIMSEVKFFIETKENIFDKDTVIKSIVEHVTKVSSLNVHEMDQFVVALKSKIEEILKLSTANIGAHTKVLEEIPKLFVELQRKSLKREIL